jgi:uncharacterized protein
MDNELAHDKKIKIAALADIHVHDTDAGKYRELFAMLSDQADIIALCGDLTNLGLSAEAELLAADIAAAKVPVIGVLGNHDHESGQPEEVRRILASGGLKLVDQEPFIIHGVGFAGVKGFGGGFDHYMLSAFGESAVKEFVNQSVNEALHLETLLRTLDVPKRVAIMHYSPISETLQGEPAEIYPYLGSSRLAEVVDHFDVAAVLHGHAHHGSLQGQTAKGVPVYNCAYPLMIKRNPDQPYLMIEV